jgi:hypothetical protein
MAWNRQQQGKYRPLVEAAWQTHSRANQIDQKDKETKGRWYREILLAATGFDTTSALDAGRDFEALMWRFEEIADDGSTYWQQRAEAGDFRRVCYAVFYKAPWKINDQPVTAAYLSGIAQQSLRLSAPPHLRTLTKGQLKTVIIALNAHRNRAEKYE